MKNIFYINWKIFRALVRDVEEETYVGLEIYKASNMRKSDKWRFKKYFPIIFTEFKIIYETYKPRRIAVLIVVICYPIGKQY